MIFKARVVGEFEKELQLENRDLYKTHINKLTAKEVYITVDDKRPTRTSPQNRLYWSYLQTIEDETGNDRYALHEHFKRQYLMYGRKDINLPNRNTFSVPMFSSTTDLDTKQFKEYLLKIEQETGILIPDSEGVLFTPLA